MKMKLVSLLAVAAVCAAGLGAIVAARADGATCTARVGGLTTGKDTVPELVVWNTGAAPIALTLVARNDQGQTLPLSPATVDVPGFNTAFVSLSQRLATAGANGKPYLGRFSLEITGDAPFSETTSVVHVTQYFGKPAKGLVKPTKPKAAFIVRPVFAPVAPQ